LLAINVGLARASLGLTDVDSIVQIERWRLMAMSSLPAMWLPFSLSYSRGNYREFVKIWRPAIWLTWLLPVFTAISFQSLFRVEHSAVEPGTRPMLQLLWASRAVHLGLIISMVLIVTNLERTLRTAVGTLRWRIKFTILGLGLECAVRFYTSSQVLIYSTPDTGFAVVNASALVLTCLLISISFLRTSLSGAQVYPSLTVLQHSITVLLAGAYLIVIGGLAKLTEMFGGNNIFPLNSFLVLVSVVALGLALVSDRTRFLSRRLISRHFRRPLYDYRNLWRTFTERTGAVIDERSYCRELVNLISETLQVLTVTAWLSDETRGKFVLVASTSLSEGPVQSSTEDEIEADKLTSALGQRHEPFPLDGCSDPWVEEIKRRNPVHFRSGGSRVCVPLNGNGQILGMLIVGDRVNGVPLSVEDFELLKSFGDQAASGLLNLQLSQRLFRAKEMEAFQSMAAFFVHDLKNTASSLSLMLQNLPAQMENPAFRQDALRAVSKAVARINEVISRLGLLREKVQIKPVEADLRTVIQAALESFSAPVGITLIRDLTTTPKVLIDPEQFQKVAVNLLVNAREALGNSGEIRVASSQENGWVVLTVRDNGCGISPEFISRSLFRPFQTTKKTGIGIGMFHCKTIVEAHRGRIEVESQPGQGTTFRVLLPISGGTP